MAENAKKSQPPASVLPDKMEIPLRWDTANEMPTIYANQLLISHAGNEFFLFFGVVTPPLILDPAKLPKSLTVQPVAKIAMTREVMEEVVALINTNFANYKMKKEKQS